MLLKRFLNFAVLLLVLVNLSGCLWGNGEGYGNKPKNDPTPSGNSAPPEEGTFYEIDPNYECPDTHAKTAYRRAIELRRDGTVILSNACASATTTLAWVDLELSITRQFLGYRDGVFEKRSAPPTVGNAEETYAEAFCVHPANNGSGYAEIIIKNSQLSGYPMAAIKLWNSELTELAHSVSRTQDQNDIVYEGSDVLLRIETTPLQNGPFKFNGTLELTLSNEPFNMLCRILK